MLRELVINFNFLLIFSLLVVCSSLSMAGDSLTPVAYTITVGDCTAAGSPSSFSP